MADISKEELRKEIAVILKDADLNTTSAKKVRQELEEKLDCNLTSRKKEIDQLVMDYVNSKEDGSQGESEDASEEDDKKKKATKRPAPAKKSKAKKAKGSSDEEASEPDEEEDGSEDSDEGYKAKKPIPKKKAPPKKKSKGSESDSDSDWGKKEKAKKASGGGRGKGGGYTRAYKLSPPLSKLMGEESMARHEVVKRMWALIKERNLYDPNNKQFAICDDDLFKVFNVKRFRTFGMMKYLKTHFHE